MITTQGGVLLFDVDVADGDVAGTYVQVSGSDSYFDIPFNPSGRTLKRGRIFQDDEEEPVIEIEIPENLATGTFCVEVCVYDEDLRVSNIIERCVTIETLGGDNSDFLTDVTTWNAFKIAEIENGQVVDEIEIGELVVDTFTETLNCQDGTVAEVEIEESDRTDEISIDFKANGELVVRISEFERDLDFGSSTCEDLVYEVDEFDLTLGGTWSYNDNNSKLILVLTSVLISSDPEIDDDELEVAEFDVEFDEAEGVLILTQDFGDEIEAIYLREL